MIVVDVAALALDATAVLTEVLERWQWRWGRVVDDRLATLLAVQAGGTAGRRGKHVIRVHRTNQQCRSQPRSTAAATAQHSRRSIHTSAQMINHQPLSAVHYKPDHLSVTTLAPNSAASGVQRPA